MKYIKNNPEFCAEREAFGVIASDPGDYAVWGCTGSGRYIISPVWGDPSLAKFAGQSGTNVVGGREPSENTLALQSAIAAASPRGKAAALLCADNSVNFLADLGGEIVNNDNLEEVAVVDNDLQWSLGEELGAELFCVIFGVPAAWLWDCYKMGVNPLPALRRVKCVRRGAVGLDDGSERDIVYINFGGLEIRVPLPGKVG